MWEAVIKEYERAGSNFEEAYHQARLARILRKDEYCFKTSKPKLWNYKYEHYRDTRQNKKTVSGDRQVKHGDKDNYSRKHS